MNFILRKITFKQENEGLAENWQDELVWRYSGSHGTTTLIVPAIIAT